MIFGLEFPPVENLIEWPAYFGEGTIFEFNKIALINIISVIVPVAIFLVASRSRQMVPKGTQNVAEMSVDFIRSQVIAPTIGHGGEVFLPLLMSLFWFIFLGNLFEIIPTFHMPANARMANPLILALLVFFVFIGVGIKHQGLAYFKNAVVVPGVPAALLVLVIPIEFLSTFIIRPFSHAVRLFANMLAGHILLVTFGVLCITLWTASALVLALPFAFGMLVGLTGFELMVAFLQAYIFTILAGVYIGGAMHPEH
ncbi:MAG: F0F1 ATP synthase subunit A [Actinomycetota bacterium]|nr:F0F1 ATP synthase subunit A [Actinomycetota bacterium]